ncbi:MAG: glutamine-hydrolyzing GMP synthase [Clostridia bacterium]|nr:glutamine-hydrolyzing GMP synthase [Clostridia bacterium]
MKNQTVLILDFGGQYKQLIARRVRELGVYSEIKPGAMSIDEIKAIDPIGIIFTGGPNSVYADASPKCDKEVLELGIPVLGICYGMQLMTYLLGGTVTSCTFSEYGRIDTAVEPDSLFFCGLDSDQVTLMSHTDYVSVLPEGFVNTAHTRNCPNAAAENLEKKLFMTQFHPEVENTRNGMTMLRNFLYNACGATGDYTMEDYIDRQVAAVRAQVGNKKVILGLSGGVDSSVCAALLSKAIGDRLVCIYVDHGFMRKNETAQICDVFGNMDLQFVCVHAEDRFLAQVAGVTEPEEKRKRIGAEFPKVFYDEAVKYADAAFLAQGTIYPDVIESGEGGDVIKSHHNVGGLPKDIQFAGVVEPLRGLFKDEVRKVGALLGLPANLVNRQPFPGPGLAIRIVGEITREKLDSLRDADAILRAEIEKAGCKADQYFAVLTNTHSVGVMGDHRTYGYVCALRAVCTNDFMTCEYAHLPHAVLAKISSRITNEVPGINRVVFDITDKPPATIEWE